MDLSHIDTKEDIEYLLTDKKESVGYKYSGSKTVHNYGGCHADLNFKDFNQKNIDLAINSLLDNLDKKKLKFDYNKLRVVISLELDET